MNSKDILVKDVLKLEWDMFQNVHNVGGARASCQEDQTSFNIMRSSQFTTWPEKVLASYFADLQDAKSKNRNLLAEKYARMMESTSPLEFAALKDKLPPLDSEVPLLIEKICEIVLEWENICAKEIPYIINRGRPLHSNADSPYSTSIATYLKGELSTYSKKTLQLLYENYSTLKSKNINGAKLIYEEMVKSYGYKSAEQANEVFKNAK